MVSDSHLPASFSRRSVLRKAALGAAAFTAASYQRVLGANDRVRMGLIGAGSRGTGVMTNFLKAGAEVVAISDIYAAHIDRAQERASAARGYSDYRAVLDRNDLDVVLIGTPDHWHATHAIDSLNAGKDVYVEKPLTLKIEEGPQIVKAARINERVCQVGTQQRSGAHYIEAKQKYIDSGKLGHITLARTWWHGNSFHLRTAPESLQSQPSNLDWARFLGPLKWREYDPQQYFNWRAYLDFGGGQVTDLFTHWIDVVHMFLDRDDPTLASAVGGVYHYKDGRTAPDTINVLLGYGGDFTATFEATLAPGVKGAAIEICGTEGRLWISRSRYEFQSAERNAEVLTVQAADSDMTLAHVQNFLDCVKSRKRPNADVYSGHRSAQASHLGNIAYVQRKQLHFDPQREEILPL